MKLVSIIFSILLCLACNNPFDAKTEEAAIVKLLDEETHSLAKGDSAKWASCWVNSEEASFIYTNAQGIYSYNGFTSLAQGIGQIEPFDLKLERSNYKYSIDEKLAFVSFDQQDNWGVPLRKTKETRALKKINGEWKIVHVGVVDMSSYNSEPTASFHMPVGKIPQNKQNGFTNISGLEGFTIGYMNVPAPTDFTPFFEGLPDNMCGSPHWGYVIEGDLRIQYPGGKEDTISAGEVFYLPAPHTGIVNKNVKFIDFSPDGKLAPVLDHIAKKMGEAAK